MSRRSFLQLFLWCFRGGIIPEVREGALIPALKPGEIGVTDLSTPSGTPHTITSRLSPIGKSDEFSERPSSRSHWLVKG